MTVRLATIAPELVQVLERKRPADLRAVAAAVSEWIVAQVALVDPKVDAALAALKQARVGETPERDHLKVLVEELDERAWDTQDQVEEGLATEQQYLDAFALARAASAVWFALETHALESALESVYEAQAATNDLAGVRRVIQDLLA
jgi:hypothetical protein